MSVAPDVGDPLIGVAGFAHALAVAGLPVVSDAVETYTRALRQVDLADPGQVYWAGRATLCHGPDDIPRYDLVFESWFGERCPAAHLSGHNSHVAPASLRWMPPAPPKRVEMRRDFGSRRTTPRYCATAISPT